MEIKVIDLKTNEVHVIWKWILDGMGKESVWSKTWYGRHVIGQDCIWVTNNSKT